MSLRLLFALSIILFTNSSQAQDKKKWDVNNPEAPFKEVSFSVSEGTWMNLDVSPDGKEIVFDLLGDIYSIPITGGTAKVLRHNFAFEVQPRFSPDGRKILFTSDAGGGDNLWVMNRDGSNGKQVTKENFRLLNNGVWTPDGQYMIAKKHFTSGRSLGAGELWIYHISGGDGLQLTVRKNDQQDVNEPSVSPDGRYIYYSEDMYPGGFFQYNKDPNNQIFVIKRYDREKGTNETITGGGGGACRPQISHDGKTLAFVRRVETKSVLYLRNIESGEEWPVYDKLTKDQQEAWTTFGVYTGFSWMPGDKNIVIWSGGNILKIDIAGINSATQIPFTCQVNQRITEAVRFKQDINPDLFTVHVIRNATTSPDGKLLLFNALGHLWKKVLPNGKPERITSDEDPEAEPSFSPDGKRIVFVSWNDSAAGAIYRLDLLAGSKPRKLTSAKGIYRTPSFSADGKKIVFGKDAGDNVFGNAFTAKPGVYMMDADGKNIAFVSENGSNPTFNLAGDRIYTQQSRNSFHSYKLDGTDDKTIFKSVYGSRFTVSPDGNWVSFVDLHNVYIAAFPGTGKTIDISAGTNALPVKKISKDAGINLHWSADNKQVHYTMGDQYYSINLADRFEFLENKADSLFMMPDSGISVGLMGKTDKPAGSIAFTNARVITMNGDEVIENGTVIIKGNLIQAVGKTGELTVPANAKIIDCNGKTIMPGFIDAHAHVNHFRNGLTPQKHWPYYTNLAYGVTTTHDPSANSEYVFAQSELVKAGEMVGPRVFSTGTILYGADGDIKAVINSIDDARSALRRTKAYGAFSVKSYNQPRREQNQMVIQAARELKMEVVPEGGSFFFHDMAMIMDGHTTVEHNIPVGVLYDDVINLWKNSKTVYTPTLIVCYNAPGGEYYWYQHTNVWEKKRLMTFTPRSVIDIRSRWRTILPEEEYENGHILVSKSVKKLSDAGVTVNMGAHGQIQGIGVHWEIWMLTQGGMSNLEALRAATLNPAKSLGMNSQLGSLEKGKLADLIIMDKNPLENIYNTESVHYTMINGRLYDCDSMNEIGNYNKPRSRFYWELNRNAAAFPWHDGTVNTASEADLD